ncbi:MAG TPA: PIN domain-containing protein [Acidobacteriaceae bacterium]
MILADSTIWIDFFRGGDPELRKQLDNEQISMHPFIVAELALGSLRERRTTLAKLDRLPQVQVSHLSEVRNMIEVHSLSSKGIGLVDAHLVASCLMTPGTFLWTRDIRLAAVAKALGIQANLPRPQ